MAGAPVAGEWTIFNVDCGVTYSEDGEQAFVKAGHPVEPYLNAVLEEEDGEEPLAERDLLEGTDMYVIEAEMVRACMGDLKRGLSAGSLTKSANKITDAPTMAGVPELPCDPSIRVAGWTIDDLDDGITYAANGEQAFVVKDHPVIAYFNRLLESQGEAPLTQDDFLEGTKLFMTSANDTRTCLADLKRELVGGYLTKSAAKIPDLTSS